MRPGENLQVYLECKPCAHFLGKNLRDNAVKGREDLHRQLGLDPALVDQVIERIGKGETETATSDGQWQNITGAFEGCCSTCSRDTTRNKPEHS